MAIEKRKFGKNGPELSILGFGAMRLPGFRSGKYDEHMDGAVDLLKKGIESGINYIDTAQLYDQGYSEKAVGKAIKGYRDNVTISTKIMIPFITSADSFKSLFETCCKNLDTERIDIFYFHGLAYKNYENQLTEMNLLKETEKLQAEGRIGQVGFSSHDKPENIEKLIDTGAFSGMLVQYNLIDEDNKDVITHAHEKGMGVAIMGPVGGGRLAGTGPDFTSIIPGEFGNAPSLALKFVWSNPCVTTALSGMESPDILEENLKLAQNFTPLSHAQYDEVGALKQKLEGLKDIYCSGCRYCLPCEQKVNIPGIFNLYICHEIYGAKKYAKDMYKLIGILPLIPGKNASHCIECGECEEKCPQEISIMEQLKRSHELLS